MSVPDPPTNIIAVPGNKTVTVSWTPGNNNGSTIYGYKITSNPVSNLPTGYVEVLGPTTTTVIVYNLTNTISYKFNVTAINQYGSSTESDYSADATPYTIPDPPSNVTAIANNGYATVYWNVPQNNNGSTIYGYTVTSIPDGLTANIIGSTTTTVIVTGLTNGTSYNFSVVATNAAGSSLTATTTTAVIPKTVPNAPNIVRTSPGNRQITLEWKSPVNTGGSPIINYIIYTYLSSDNTEISSIATTNNNTIYLIGNLLINTSYYFKIKAVNVVGNSPFSTNSDTVKTYDVPNAPTNITAYPGVNSARVTWIAPTNVLATGYDVYRYPISNTSTILGSIGIDLSLNIINLDRNTSYSFVVVARNDSGASEYSNASNTILTNNIPSAPTGVTATAGNQSALLNWTNGYNGGSSITSYIIKGIPYSGSPIVSMNVQTKPGYISGLLIDTSYSFTVTAVNAVGISDVSGSTQGYIRTYGYPNPPTDLSYDASFGNVTIHWTEPTNTGRTRITGYDIISSNGLITTSTNEQTVPVIISPPTQININNLINGQTYTFYVYSRNIVGQSRTYSTINTIPARYPDPPIDLSTNPGNKSATIEWRGDTFNGGSPITSYNIKIRNIITNSITNSIVYTNPAEITGLEIDTSYSFAVNAINRFGSSSDSTFSTPIRTFNIPGKPTNIVGFSGTRSIRLFWAKPISDGRTPITGYRINLYDNNLNSIEQILLNNVVDLSYTIPNLLNNKGYILTMNSRNIVGDSLESQQTITINTFNTPNAIYQLSGSPGDFKVFLNWTSPYNGGARILRYDISVNPLNPDIISGNLDISVNALSNSIEPPTYAVVTNLLRDTSYNFTINAVNEVGSAVKTTVITVKTNNVPEPPNITNVTAGESEITISWDVPYNGGSAITNYIIHSYRKQPVSGIFLYNSTKKITNNVTFTIFNGLLNGNIYKFRIIAVNGVGESLLSDYSDEISPIYVELPPKGELSKYCKNTCNPIYKKMATSTNNPNVSKRMLYGKTVNSKCSVKNNVTYDQLVAQYNFPPLDVSGINQRQAIIYKSPAFLNAMF